MDKLKPCPFCGKQPTTAKGDHNQVLVSCNECEVDLYAEDAMVKWNRRAADTHRDVPTAWISVKDRLPDSARDVVVAYNTGTTLASAVGAYDCIRWLGGDGAPWPVRSFPITHWMPLPTPPEGQPPKGGAHG